MNPLFSLFLLGVLLGWLVQLFLFGTLLGYLAHRIYLNSRTDIDEIAELAVAIRRDKNKRYAKYVNDLPYCAVCGPGVRHINLQAV
jgi:hypothetical protein